MSVPTPISTPIPSSLAPTVCSQKTDCTSCTGIFAQSAGCYWCPGTGSCVSSSLNDACGVGATSDTSCTSSLYTIIFIVVVVFLGLMCCGSCLIGRYRRRENSSILNAPLLPEQVRNILFRNSLADEGEDEWMCVICGYDNKPRAKHCPMCGTSKKFTIDYKSEKKYRYKQSLKRKKEMKKESGAGNDDKKTISVSIKSPEKSMQYSSMSAAVISPSPPPLTLTHPLSLSHTFFFHAYSCS